MATVTLKGNAINTIGELPAVQSNAADFSLVTTSLGIKSLKDYAGKRIVLNIFPSVDTPTCATSVRQFNEKASNLANTVVLCVSRDLPFAQARFCGAEGIENVEMLSDFNTGSFGKEYGVLFTDGPLQGLLSRAIVVVDENGKVVYTEQVEEIANEPNYAKVLEVLK